VLINNRKIQKAGGGASYVKFFEPRQPEQDHSGHPHRLINEHMPNSTVGIGRIDIEKTCRSLM
jgi:hypothetical protein